MNPHVYIFASILLVTLSQLLFKQGINQLKGKSKPEGMPQWKHWLNMAFQPYIFSGLFCNGLAAISWLLALSNMDLSYVFPFISLNYILVPLGAIWLFKERMSRNRLVGIGIICIGIALIALSPYEVRISSLLVH